MVGPMIVRARRLRLRIKRIARVLQQHMRCTTLEEDESPTRRHGLPRFALVGRCARAESSRQAGFP